jgi:hypothetical protein
MAKLWDYFDGEPFLDNPHLFVMNKPRKRKKGKMALKRNKKGQFTKRKKVTARRKTTRRAVAHRKVSRRRSTRRRVTARSVKVVRHPVLVNPRRRRRHGYRRNPSLGGMFNRITLKTVGFTVVGALGVPFVEGFVTKYIPANILGTDATMNKVVRYAVKIGSAWGLSWGVGKVAGPEAKRAVLVGALASITVGIIRDTGLLGGTATPTSGTTGTGRYLGAYPGMGAQPFLGSAVTTRTAERLNPANRF